MIFNKGLLGNAKRGIRKDERSHGTRKTSLGGFHWTLAELLEVLLDLLPHEAGFCIQLLKALKEVELVAGTRLGAEAEDLRYVLYSFLETCDDVDCELDSVATEPSPRSPQSPTCNADKPPEPLGAVTLRRHIKRLDDKSVNGGEQGLLRSGTGVSQMSAAYATRLSGTCSPEADKRSSPDFEFAAIEEATGCFVSKSSSMPVVDRGFSSAPTASIQAPKPPKRKANCCILMARKCVRQLALGRENKRLPWLPDASNGGFAARSFVLFEFAEETIAGKLLAAFLVCVIAVSTLLYVLESMPQFRSHPPGCFERRDAGLPLRPEDCEPQPAAWFFVLEALCIAIFTLDYAVRLATIHAFHTEDEERSAFLKKLPQSVVKTLRYTTTPLNIIDFLAIAPFYMDFILPPSFPSSALKVLRLLRVLRMCKLAKHHDGIRMFGQVLYKSGEPLAILLFFNVILVILFGALLWYAEGQTFSVEAAFTQPSPGECEGDTVNASFPTGVYVRPTASSYDDDNEATPFRSIPYSMWWTCVTMTTVGYGDFAPTSVLGKTIGVSCFYCGIIFLALPISVIGQNLEAAYNELQKRKNRKLDLSDFVGEDEEDNKRHIRNTVRLVRMPCLKAEGRPPCLPVASSFRRRLFLMLDDPIGSRFGNMFSIMMLMCIVVSTVCFILETMPDFNDTPKACVKANQLTVPDCEPVPSTAFNMIEVACVSIFTVDYVLRVATVHSAKPADINHPAGDDRKYMGLQLTVFYCTRVMNIIDFLAILPFYLGQLGGDIGGGSVLRVLRLFRLFRVLKMPKLRACAEMFINIINEALPALLILFLATNLCCVFFSSLMVFAEGSWYSTEHFQAEYPLGVYIRPTVDGYGVEATPFRSIPEAFWWFYTTSTTVGYGDYYPTTTIGRFVGVGAFYMGIVLLALPITVIGGSFSTFYPVWVEEFGNATGGCTASACKAEEATAPGPSDLRLAGNALSSLPPPPVVRRALSMPELPPKPLQSNAGQAWS
eukprot:TRINITY_DN112171_c0_g1_i1.p1 TRINITY_DN112171_c0_g1~~TRINITY_DN112171_c0_g1_i1.p1  ORF type:complete len:1002 (-),score=176.99 TRINITY_DN112171_c0_g1_i1:167-3172(-)